METGNRKQRVVTRLRPGDEVWWNDPDGALCSKLVKIKSFALFADDVIRHVDESGDVLECCSKELELNKRRLHDS